MSPRKRHLLDESEWLKEVVRELTAGLDLNSTARRVLALGTQTVGAEWGDLILLDEQKQPAVVLLLREGKFRSGGVAMAKRLLADGLEGWVLRNRQAARVDDVERDARWLRLPSPDWKARSVLCLPLVSPRRTIGILTCAHSQPDYFDDADLRALQFVADQATIALENAWLFAAEERRRQLADMLGEIARALAATLDLDEVLRLILESLGRVVPYDSASVFLLEGHQLVIRAWQGFENPEAIQNLAFSIDSPHIMARVAARREPLLCADVQQEEGWQDIPGVPLIRGWIGVPLIARGQLVGALTVDSLQPDAYTEEDARIVAAFASHAAIAIANAQLLRQLQRQLDDLAFLHRTGQALIASLEMEDVLRSLMEIVRQHFQLEAASVALVDEVTGELVFWVATGAASGQVVGMRLKPGQGIAGWVAESGQPIIVPSVADDPRWYPGVDRETGFRTRAIVAVPIRLGEEILGVLEGLNPPEDRLCEEDMQLLISVAALAASAIQNARHFHRARDAEERYANLFENSADPIMITDADGRIIEVNRKFCQTLGYVREELLQREMPALVSCPQTAQEWLERVLRGEEIFGNLEVMTADGKSTPLEVRATRIFHGTTPYIQWVFHDITERLQLERIREDLTHMIVHDLRNPLSSIMSSLELIRMAVEDPTVQIPLDQLFAIAQRSGERLFRLIDSILDLARLEAGKAKLSRETIRVRELVEEALDQVRPIAMGKDISLEAGLPEDLPSLIGDRTLLLRALVNLLDNGIKFTPPKGTVRVEIHPLSSDALLFAVSDTGPGIPREYHQQIFDRFVRLPGQHVQGTGVGLALCKLAVEAHGGRIWVESQPGEGATFKFTLPLEPPK